MRNLLVLFCLLSQLNPDLESVKTGQVELCLVNCQYGYKYSEVKLLIYDNERLIKTQISDKHGIVSIRLDRKADYRIAVSNESSPFLSLDTILSFKSIKKTTELCIVDKTPSEQLPISEFDAKRDVEQGKVYVLIPHVDGALEEIGDSLHHYYGFRFCQYELTGNRSSNLEGIGRYNEYVKDYLLNQGFDWQTSIVPKMKQLLLNSVRDFPDGP